MPIRILFFATACNALRWPPAHAPLSHRATELNLTGIRGPNAWFFEIGSRAEDLRRMLTEITPTPTATSALTPVPSASPTVTAVPTLAPTVTVAPTTELVTTFSQLRNVVSCGVPNITLGTSFEVHEALNIAAGSTLTVLGSGVTLTANVRTKFFDVYGSLHLRELTLANGSTSVLVCPAVPSSDCAGGSIGVWAGGVLSLINCIIRDSSAGWGGAVFGYFGGSISATNSTIARCFGVAGAGIFLYYAASADIDQCDFTDNSAYNPDVDRLGLIGVGFEFRTPALGACAWATVIVRNSTFRRNIANFGGMEVSYGSTAHVSDSLFEDNWASMFGAGLVCWESGASVSCERCVFRNNSVGSPSSLAPVNTRGAAVHVQGFVPTSGYFRDCVFDRNSVWEISPIVTPPSIAGKGGAISVDAASVVLERSIFWGNRADTEGGAITVYSSASAAITNCSFLENSAVLGAAIHVKTSANLIMNGGMLKHSFTGDEAHYCTGALHLNGASADVMNVKFVRNSEQAICAEEGAVARISGSSFLRNRADAFSNIKGAGIYAATEGALAALRYPPALIFEK